MPRIESWPARKPPMTGPSTLEVPKTAMKKPWYRERSRGGTMSPMIASASDIRPPAPMPWMRPERGQLVHRVGEAAEHRADDEDADGEQVERPPAVEVGQLAVQRRGDRRGDQERRRRPGLQVVALQVVGDGADRGRDDGLVERGQEHAEHEAGEDRDDLAVGEDAAGVRRGGRRAGVPAVGRAGAGGLAHRISLVVEGAVGGAGVGDAGQRRGRCRRGGGRTGW